MIANNQFTKIVFSSKGKEFTAVQHGSVPRHGEVVRVDDEDDGLIVVF